MVFNITVTTVSLEKKENKTEPQRRGTEKKNAPKPNPNIKSRDVYYKNHDRITGRPSAFKGRHDWPPGMDSVGEKKNNDFRTNFRDFRSKVLDFFAQLETNLTIALNSIKNPLKINYPG